MRSRRLLPLLLVALLLAACGGPGGASSRVPARAAADPAGGADPGPAPAGPTLVPAGSATGGGWSDAQVRHYAEVFDVLVVGGSAKASRVRLFREANPRMVVLAYTGGFDVHEDQPLFGWIRANHPGWFLRDAQARPIHTYRNPKRWALDCGNVEVRDFFADSAGRRVRQLGADGILEDNVFPTWDHKNLARGADRLEGYASVEEWRASLERYLEALERAVAPGRVAANEVVPWTRHGQIVSIEDLPMGGPRWEEIVTGFQAIARQPGRTPWLQQHLGGPDDPMRSFATASYLMAVEPGAWLGLQWNAPREAFARAPEFALDLGRPLGPARVQGGIWFRDWERARVLVNPGGAASPVPWPSWSGPASTPLPPGRAGIAWRPGAARVALPDWIEP